MIRPFSLSDLDSILQIESQSFPKSPYDWMTFLNLHTLYPETFLVYVNPSTPRPGASGSLGVDLSGAFLLVLKGGVGRRRTGQDKPGRNRRGDRGYIISLRMGISSPSLSTPTSKERDRRETSPEVMEAPQRNRVWAEVRRSNHGAQAFYSKMGFQITGLIPNYYGNEDALIIQWTPAIGKSY